MSKISELIDKADGVNSSYFNYNRDIKEIIRQLNDVNFMAEIDHEQYYITQVIQVYKNGEGQVYNLTDDEREEFYTTGNIASMESFKLACTLHWYINAKERYVQVFVSRGDLKKLSDPKTDYGKIFEELSKNKVCEKAEFKLDRISDEDIKSCFENLIKVFEFSKFHTIDDYNFDKKVIQDVSKYWGNLTSKNKIVDDEYQETSRPEYIKIPHAHNKVVLNTDYDLTTYLKNPGFDEINYEENGIKKEFTSLKEADNYFYSLVDYINLLKIKPTIHQTADVQKIASLEKHYLSGKWPIAKTAEESESLAKELTRYNVYVTKFHDTVVVKEEIWEMGIVYIITNIWDKRSIN